MENEYEDAVCPECTGSINPYGFCYDCSFDYEDYLLEESESDIWDNLSGGAGGIA